MRYELYYSSGGHVGPFHSLKEAIDRAYALAKGVGGRDRISVFEGDPPPKPETKAIITINLASGPSQWAELHRRFRVLKDKVGADKSSSFVMNIIYGQDGEIGIELGTYDIGSWPRCTYLGPFKTEQEAMLWTEVKIIEAEQVVLQEKAQEENHDRSES